MKMLRVFAPATLAGFALLLTPAPTPAQEKISPLSITTNDSAAAASATDFAVHPLGTPGSDRQTLWAAGTRPSSDDIPAISAPGFYPGDLSNPRGQVTVETAQSHGIYVNCLPSCWGTPSNFLQDLGESDFIHLVDQYVGSHDDDRYTVGPGGVLTGTFPHTVGIPQILAIAHLAGQVFGTGYHHIHHIYLPPGQDICLAPGACYSPDVPASFVFCAFHGSVTFPVIGHVLFTVEPFQNVPGCAVKAPSPNGLLIDSTADVLSHELFETITDPDGTAWWNRFDLDLFGAEIGDECQNFNFSYGSVLINEKRYEVQPEYSNAFHGCTFSPSRKPEDN